MNLSPYEIALIAGGFTIIGTLLGAWIGYKNALKLHNIVEFNKAATGFRSAFLPILIFLKYKTDIGGIGNTNDISGLLNFGYVHYHLKAFEIFKDHLSTKKRIAINKAWQKCYHPDDPKVLNVDRFSNKSFNGKQKSKEELKKLTPEAIERIEEILKFAEHK